MIHRLELSTWHVRGAPGAEDDVPPADVHVDPARLPLVAAGEDGGDQVLRMFWLDAYEDPFKQPGKCQSSDHTLSSFLPG